MLTPRAQRLVLKTLLLAAVVAAASYTGGCEMARHESMSLGDTALMASGGRGATTSDAVFEAPEANALAVAYGRENLPESYRLDERMNIHTAGPALATSQWSYDNAPDLTRARYVYIPVSTSSSSILIPVFRGGGYQTDWRARPYWR